VFTSWANFIVAPYRAVVRFKWLCDLHHAEVAGGSKATCVICYIISATELDSGIHLSSQGFFA
jgi:hypothetical protein